jgi:hypothetical protein
LQLIRGQALSRFDGEERHRTRGFQQTGAGSQHGELVVQSTQGVSVHNRIERLAGER